MERRIRSSPWRRGPEICRVCSLLANQRNRFARARAREVSEPEPEREGYFYPLPGGVTVLGFLSASWRRDFTGTFDFIRLLEG